MSNNKAYLVELNGYSDIASNNKAKNVAFINFNNTWYQMVLNQNIVTLFAILYINLLDGQNNFSVLSHVKDNFYYYADEDSCYS